ncbi:hypothetical protein [Streptacidiphilus sp. PAMC 29251]
MEDEASSSAEASRQAGRRRNGDPYLGVLDAALFAVEMSEKDRPLDMLDTLLKPWIREVLDRDLGLAYSADNLTQLADDVARILGRGYHYCELRKQLSQDRNRSDRVPEAIWRIVDDISWLKVFTVAVLPSEESAFALRRTVGPGRFGSDTAHWQFSAMPHLRLDRVPEQRADFLIVVSGMGPDHASGQVHVPAGLRDHPVWVEQLGHAFAGLGHTVTLS